MNALEYKNRVDALFYERDAMLEAGHTDHDTIIKNFHKAWNELSAEFQKDWPKTSVPSPLKPGEGCIRISDIPWSSGDRHDYWSESNNSGVVSDA